MHHESICGDSSLLCFLEHEGSSKEFKAVFKGDDSFTRKSLLATKKLVHNAVDYTMEKLNGSNSVEQFDTNSSFKNSYEKCKGSRAELMNAKKLLDSIEGLSLQLTRALRSFKDTIET